MQFSEEWDWQLEDFMIIGTMLFVMGLLYEFLSSKVKTKNQRLLVGIGVILLTMYLWAEMAVGIFTNIGS